MLAVELDQNDERVLSELQQDARITMAELGRRVGLSQPAVTERVRKLESAGVITGYHAAVNPARLGYAIRALVHVGRLDQERMSPLVEASPEVLNAYSVTGGDDWVLEIAVADVTHLETVLRPFCSLTDTRTAVILRILRERSPLKSPAALRADRARGR